MLESQLDVAGGGWAKAPWNWPPFRAFGRGADPLAVRRNRGVVLTASAGVFQRSVQAACTLLIFPVVLKSLGPARFGIWGAATSLGWLGGLFDIGMGAAVMTAVVRSAASDRPQDAQKAVAGALAMGGIIGAAIMAALGAMLMAGALPVRMHGYAIAAIALAINVPLSVANSAWMGLQKGYVAGLWELVQTLAATAALVAAAIWSAGLNFYVAVFYASIVASNFGSLLHLFLRHPELRPAGMRVPFQAMKSVAKDGSWYCILGVVGGLSFMLDNVLALELLGPDASAQMAIVLRICLASVGILCMMSQPLWPAFAEAAERGDRRWIRNGVMRGGAVLVGLGIVGSTFLVAAGEPLLRWWLRTDLKIGRGVLWTMAIWIVVLSVSRMPSLLLNGLSIIRFQIGACVIGTIVAFAMKVTLAPRFGIAGILWGTTATAACIVIPAMVWRIRRWSRAFAHLHDREEVRA